MTNPTTRHRQTARKSLRQSLKELLQRGRHQAKDQAGLLGSGILRRGGSGIYLPEPSRVSLFPNFESTTQFDIDSYSVHIPNHFANEVDFIGEAICLSPQASRASLLPLRSLSHFNLNQTYAEHGRPFRPTQLSTVPEILMEESSRQASLASLHSLKPSKSKLRIRGSNRSLRSDNLSQSEAPRSSRTITSEPRSKESLKTLRSHASFQGHTDHLPSALPPARSAGDQSKRTSSDQPSIASIKHFDSFCVLDTNSSGCPVTATSENLKYVFDVGEQFFLNNQECTDASMDIVTGYDADGNEVTHLVLFSPLISPSSGRSRFLLAALIDVTFFIKDAAAVPQLDTISEESVLDEGIATPVYRHPPTVRIHDVVRKTSKYELSCEDLLGGCFVEDDNHWATEYSPIDERANSYDMGMYADTEVKDDPGFASFDDVWTDLAREEMMRGRNSPLQSTASTRSGHTTPHTSPSLSDPSPAVLRVDKVLDSFMSQLQQLYSDFFLLAKSPLDAGFYEICNVSPSVYVSKDYIHGHLSQSSRNTITKLSELLGGDTAFDMDVRWGITSDIKRLYCIPLFGQRDLTWICILADANWGILW
jgi:hypothetical protein